MRFFTKSFLLAFLFSFSSEAQNINDFFLYSYDHALFNPAAAGAESRHVFGLNGTLDYKEEAWKSKTAPITGIMSYNGNIKAIHSGIGAFAVVNRYFIRKTSKVGISYNYKVNLAPKHLFVSVSARPQPAKRSIMINFKLYQYLMHLIQIFSQKNPRLSLIWI